MTVAFSRSEVVLSTDPLRLSRSPEDMRLSGEQPFAPAKEVIRNLAALRVPPRPQREWHRIFGADQ